MKEVFCTVCKKISAVLSVSENKGTVYYSLGCGHRFMAKVFSDTVFMTDMLEIKRKAKEFFSKKHEWNLEMLIGNRIGKDGHSAFINQVIDRANNYYKKFVKSQGKIVKDIEEKLSDHRQGS